MAAAKTTSTTQSTTTTTAEDAAVAAAPAEDYSQVVIIKTDSINGHGYRRGQKPFVNAVTLAALTAKGMI